MFGNISLSYIFRSPSTKAIAAFFLTFVTHILPDVGPALYDISDASLRSRSPSALLHFLFDTSISLHSYYLTRQWRK
jgi:hypothetical protein